jgi:hypothetical protein
MRFVHFGSASKHMLSALLTSVSLSLAEQIKDGGTYIAMPLSIAGSTYEVEFREELPHNEVITQKWPVTPYQVRVQNNSHKNVFAQLHIDGQKVDQMLLTAHSGEASRHTFSSIPVRLVSL